MEKNIILHLCSHLGWNDTWRQFPDQPLPQKVVFFAFYISTPRDYWWAVWETWQYSWTSCPRPLCDFTCPLCLLSSFFFPFPPCSLSSFLLTSSLLPSPPPHLYFSLLPAFLALPFVLMVRSQVQETPWNNRKPLFQCHKSHVNGEQRTGCYLKIPFFASRLLQIFTSCDIYFSFGGTSNLKAAGLRSVVRITTDLSEMLYCWI